MLLVHPESGTCTTLERSQGALLDTLGRLKEELESWKKYRCMGQSDSRYVNVATEEFQHALLALSDFMNHMVQEANGTEKRELRNLLSTHLSQFPSE